MERSCGGTVPRYEYLGDRQEFLGFLGRYESNEALSESLSKHDLTPDPRKLQE